MSRRCLLTCILSLFLVWAAALVVGYGLLLDGLKDQIRPAPQDLITTIYISASTLVPLAYGVGVRPRQPATSRRL